MDASNPGYWPTTYIAVVPRITGCLSAISSAVIIFLVFRAATRLSTVYHRIMLCMSLCDILGSIGYALTTLPMPAVMPKEEELNLLYWPGPRYGNIATCNAQAFVIASGAIGVFGYNVTLCVYYACSIGFRMKDKSIRRFVQPIILCGPIIFSLFIAILPMFDGMYNPPTHLGSGGTPWCYARPYPTVCDGESCIRGSTFRQSLPIRIYIGAFFCGVFSIIISLIIVVLRVVHTSCQLRSSERMEDIDTKSATNQSGESASSSGAIRTQVEIKIIILQAIAYVSAYLIGTGWILFPHNTYDQQLLRFKVGAFVGPIQGLFNLFIFICHKVYNYRCLHPKEGICHIMKLLFTTRMHEPYFITEMSIVHNDQFAEAVDELKVAIPALEHKNRHENLSRSHQHSIENDNANENSNIEAGKNSSTAHKKNVGGSESSFVDIKDFDEMSLDRYSAARRGDFADDDNSRNMAALSGFSFGSFVSSEDHSKKKKRGSSFFGSSLLSYVSGPSSGQSQKPTDENSNSVTRT